MGSLLSQHLMGVPAGQGRSWPCLAASPCWLKVEMSQRRWRRHPRRWRGHPRRWGCHHAAAAQIRRAAWAAEMSIFLLLLLQQSPGSSQPCRSSSPIAASPRRGARGCSGRRRRGGDLCRGVPSLPGDQQDKNPVTPFPHHLKESTTLQETFTPCGGASPPKAPHAAGGAA